MKGYKIQLTLLDYWMTGYGESAGMRADELQLRDRSGLPYLPGRAVKGLFREASQLLFETQAGSTEGLTLEFLFGSPAEGGQSTSGTLRFTNAQLPDLEREVLTANPDLRRELFDTVSATAMEQGVAKDHSLRTVEVCIPLTLEATVGFDPVESPTLGASPELLLTEAAKLIRGIGKHRNRGLGRCVCHLKTEVTS